MLVLFWLREDGESAWKRRKLQKSKFWSLRFDGAPGSRWRRSPGEQMEAEPGGS